MDILSYENMIIDWLFVVAAALVALFSSKGCAYKHANILLAYQFLVAIGFSTAIIALDMYDGLYFDAVLTVVYFAYYHYIAKTGDKFLSNLSLIIGGYHFALTFSRWIGLNTQQIIGISYQDTMVWVMTIQLLLAFRGALYGLCDWLNNRARYAHWWNYRDLGGNK